MKFARFISVLLLLAYSSVARAETIVLVQGYLGDAGSWRATGVADVLDKDGWRDAGHLTLTPKGVAEKVALSGRKHRFYTIDLPTEAPVPVQANYLAAYLEFIGKKYKDDKIILVGHSAGGVVARTAMVSYPELKVAKLITIASPNRGTGRAETGLMVANSPVGFMSPMFGAGTLARSRDLYRDLVRERPGTFLGWLNSRQHPDAEYVSVVRANAAGYPGDDVVPGWSQDFSGVFGLKDYKTKTLVTRAPHELAAADGGTILKIVGAHH